MNPDLSHVRVTVIDFLGVFLPGTVWLLLLYTLDGVLRSPSRGNPVEAVRSLFISTAPRLGASFYIIALIAALIAGYVAKALAIKPSETISTILDAPLAHWRKKPKDRRSKGEQGEKVWSTSSYGPYRFPYDVQHSDTSYYKIIRDLVVARSGVSREDFPSSQFFNTCKRLLKLHATSLWEEAEYREAEVRMLASLFLASLFNLILVAVDGIRHQQVDVGWALWAIGAATIVCLALRMRRRREVESVYFATLAALILIPTSGNIAKESVGRREIAA